MFRKFQTLQPEKLKHNFTQDKSPEPEKTAPSFYKTSYFKYSDNDNTIIN